MAVCNDRIDYAYEDLCFLEPACMVEVLALSNGKKLVSVNPALTKQVRPHIDGERSRMSYFLKRSGACFNCLSFFNT